MNKPLPDRPYAKLGEQIAEAQALIQTASKFHWRLSQASHTTDPTDVLYCMAIIRQAAESARKPLKAIRKEASRQLEDLVKTGRKSL
jgi:hypothetical protein